MEKFESNFKDLKDGLDQNEFQGKESVINYNEPFQSIVFKVLYFPKMCPIFVCSIYQNFEYFESRYPPKTRAQKNRIINDQLQQTPCLVGGLYSVYYHNKDTKLLLDLLAASSGIGPCLKLLCLFDKSLQQKAQVENVKVIY